MIHQGCNEAVSHRMKFHIKKKQPSLKLPCVHQLSLSELYIAKVVRVGNPCICEGGVESCILYEKDPHLVETSVTHIKRNPAERNVSFSAAKCTELWSSKKKKKNFLNFPPAGRVLIYVCHRKREIPSLS